MRKAMTLQELKRVMAEASQVFVLTDEHVAALWLPELKRWLGCEAAVELVVPAGEAYKTLDTAQQVWEGLLQHHADRDAILVNLGGGMVCDLGGFAAACYQRGIRFVNVPTTLLAMVDAAYGGKTGVDFGGAKNAVGLFAQPLEVRVNPVYLSTLPERELRSGLAEMLKYGYIADPSMLGVDQNNYEQYLLCAGRLKQEIVAQDYRDVGCRQVLNFGHTAGHALESWSLTTGPALRHGEAVAIGMGCALWLSCRMTGLDEAVLEAYWPKMRALLPSVVLPEPDVLDAVLSYLVYDKKNREGELRFVLLEAPGKPLVGQVVPLPLVREALCEVIQQMQQRHG